MGSIYLETTFDASDEKTLKERFKNHVDNQRFESGNDTYSANWASNGGLNILSRSFASIQEASDYIQQNQSKYDRVMAVRVGDFNRKFPESAADKKLVEDHSKISLEVEGFHEEIFRRALAGKTAKRGCSHCGSAIALKAIPLPKAPRHGASVSFGYSYSQVSDIPQYRLITDCPVCLKNLLVTATDEKRLESLKVKHKSLSQKLKEAESSYKAKMNGDKNMPLWYLGGWTAY